MTEKASDQEAVGQIVQFYFDGLYYGDTAKLKKVFHPQAFVIGKLQGQSLFLSLSEFLGFVEEAPKPSESGEEYDMKIVSLDLAGEVGTVKVADLYQGLRFTDYLTVAKVEGDWVIVNKVFHHAPKG